MGIQVRQNGVSCQRLSFKALLIVVNFCKDQVTCHFRGLRSRWQRGLVAAFVFCVTVQVHAQIALSIAPGWNLLGNGTNQTLSVQSLFGNPEKVTSVWKWDATAQNWQFYAPSLDLSALKSYVATNGYTVLGEIKPGDGYWINAKTAVSLPIPDAPLFSIKAAQLKIGWNLVANGPQLAAKAFTLSMADQMASSSGTTSGVASLNSLWAWHAQAANWYFYSPLLDDAGGSKLSDFIASRAYRDFALEGKTVSNGTGIWVNVSKSEVRAKSKVGPACLAGATTQKLSFVHVGDLHANFDLDEDKYSKIRAFYQKVLQENPYTVFTNAGDDHEKGSLADQYSKGEAVTQVTTAMQFDVRALGNHDFAWGEKHLLDFSWDPRSLVLNGNVRYTGNELPGLGTVDFGVLDVGCLKVGFFSLVSAPWNELDFPFAGDYFPSMPTSLEWTAAARQIVQNRRSEVDIMVMVSHLGYDDDVLLAQNVTGIDLIMGGHSHFGPQSKLVNGTRVMQPNFYAEGVSRIDLDVDLSSRRIRGLSITEQPVRELTTVDTELHQKISTIVSRYAPDIQKPIAYLEYGVDAKGILTLAAKAGMAVHAADAALLTPELIHPGKNYWAPGEITAKKFHDTYYVERQIPGTTGINGLYKVHVSGVKLALMKSLQPNWVFVGPTSPDPALTYSVLINKGAAYFPKETFPNAGIEFPSVTFMSETWQTLVEYGRSRTGKCLTLDTDTTSPNCQTPSAGTVWTFAKAAGPLLADSGTATLAYFDPTSSAWGPAETAFGTAASFSLPSLADAQARVMAVPKTSPGQGFSLTHNEPPNGAFLSKGLVSNYTVMMDVLWPQASLQKWRALWQTSMTNADDADWFAENTVSGGIGTGAYFGTLAVNQWYRIAMVVRAAPIGGSLQFFIDGQLVGERTDATERWALGPRALLFADNDDETEKGFVSRIQFAGYAMTATEVAAHAKAGSR